MTLQRGRQEYGKQTTLSFLPILLLALHVGKQAGTGASDVIYISPLGTQNRPRKVHVEASSKGTGIWTSCGFVTDALNSGACFSLWCVCVCVCVLVAQLCLTLCDPMDYNPLGSSVHGVLQAWILEWVAIPFSSRSSQPRDWTHLSHIAGRLFTIWATREAPLSDTKCLTQTDPDVMRTWKISEELLFFLCALKSRVRWILLTILLCRGELRTTY